MPTSSVTEVAVPENPATATGPPPLSAGIRGLASRASSYLLAAPATLGMIVLLVIPLLVFFFYSFLTPQPYSVSLPLTFQSFTQAASSPIVYKLALTSIRTGAMAAALTVAIALPVTYWLRYQAGPRMRSVVLFTIAASLFVSYLVRLYAWLTLLGSQGVVNSGLVGVGIIDEPIGALLFSSTPVAIAAVHISIPFAVIALYAAMRPLDESYLESAHDLGANSWQRWRRVILPLLAAPMATTFFFVFLLTSADWVMPVFLGGRDGQMLGQRIYDQFLTIGNYPGGAALALMMLVVYGVIFALLQLLLRVSKVRNVRWGT